MHEELSNPELEAAIIARPDDAQAFMVYGDWLQSKGDPRGELVALQASKLFAESSALIEKHRARFVAGLVGELEWHLGFLRSARLSMGRESRDVAADVSSLLRHPSAKFLRELVVGLAEDFTVVTAAIGEVGSKALRELFIGDYQYPDEVEISWTSMGDMGAVWHRLPNLEKLVIQGGEITLGTIDAPKLRHLELRTGGLPVRALRSIASAMFPSLETLIVWTGDANYGADSSFDDLAPILDGAGLPRLKHLGIMNCEYADEVCQAIGHARILPQLETLDLSMGNMSDTGRRALIEAKSALKHLRTLNLEYNTLDSVEGLAGLCAEVKLRNQREDYDDDDQRYVWVGE